MSEQGSPSLGEDQSSSKVFLAPCSRSESQANLERTVESPVPVEDYRGHTELDFSGGIYLWGVKDTNESSWNKISQGDTLLFYTGKRMYTYAATVESREHNPALAAESWSMRIGASSEDRRTKREWEYVIYLSDPIQIELPSQQFHEQIGYKDEYPQGFRRVTQDYMESLRAEYGSPEELIEQFRATTDNDDSTTGKKSNSKSDGKELRQSIRRELQRGNDVLLYGPSQTGKQNIALSAAESWAAEPETVSEIRLFEGIQYDDLIEAPAPADDETHPDGSFKRHCDRAIEADRLSRGGAPNHVIVLQGIETVDLPTTFGEVLPLICNRDSGKDQTVQLRYSGDTFELPQNVRIVATLASDNKRLGGINANFRRHVRTVTVTPDYELLLDEAELDAKIGEVLGTTPDDATVELEGRSSHERFQIASIRALRRLNEALYDPPDQIGHEYLTDALASEQALADAWQYDIFPQLWADHESAKTLGEQLSELIPENPQLVSSKWQPKDKNQARLAAPQTTVETRQLVLGIASGAFPE